MARKLNSKESQMEHEKHAQFQDSTATSTALAVTSRAPRPLFRIPKAIKIRLAIRPSSSPIIKGLPAPLALFHFATIHPAVSSLLITSPLLLLFGWNASSFLQGIVPLLGAGQSGWMFLACSEVGAVDGIWDFHVGPVHDAELSTLILSA